MRGFPIAARDRSPRSPRREAHRRGSAALRARRKAPAVRRRATRKPSRLHGTTAVAMTTPVLQLEGSLDQTTIPLDVATELRCYLKVLSLIHISEPTRLLSISY